MKTACKNSNRFRSYGSLNDYANFSNVEKIEKFKLEFLKHLLQFYHIFGYIYIDHIKENNFDA